MLLNITSLNRRIFSIWLCSVSTVNILCTPLLSTVFKENSPLIKVRSCLLKNVWRLQYVKATIVLFSLSCSWFLKRHHLWWWCCKGNKGKSCFLSKLGVFFKETEVKSSEQWTWRTTCDSSEKSFRRQSPGDFTFLPQYTACFINL